MVDHVDRAKRSFIMAAVHSENTSPEMAVRKIVYGLGYRYRLHVRTLPGCPDIVFPGARKVIFVHGCFWHRHGRCRYATLPKTRPEFWASKFAANKTRDHRVKMSLKRLNWGVLTVWQCELKRPETLTERLNDFLKK